MAVATHTCEYAGCANVVEPTGRPGRPSKYCAEHRGLKSHSKAEPVAPVNIADVRERKNGKNGGEPAIKVRKHSSATHGHLPFLATYVKNGKAMYRYGSSEDDARAKMREALRA